MVVREGLSRILEWTDRGSIGFLFLVGILLDVLIGLLDHLSGYEISFGLFYLVPVVLVSRCGEKIVGVAICVICAGTWLAADLLSGHEYSRFWMPYWNALVRLGFFVAVSLLVVSTRRTMESLEKMSRTDPLTGAANPRGFHERAQMEIDRSFRYGHIFTAAYLDVDDFKAINDKFGHSAGDEVLARVAQVISENIRKTDTVGRLGGDEFAILFPETDHEFAEGVISRIQVIVSEDMKIRSFSVTLSLGVVTFQVTPNSVDEMIKEADRLMYTAKRSGKNTMIFRTFTG